MQSDDIYDNRSRVSSVTDVFGQVVRYAYDANSNRTQLSLNGGTSATYQYDAINRLTQLTDNASLNTTFAYDATNKLTSRTLPNGVVTTSEYDGLNRLTRLTHVKGANTLADFQYQFNAVNNISQMTDAVGSHSYTYDSVDRLTAATHPNQTNESYTFDDVGNRTASHQGSSYSYQSFNRLVGANGSSFTYDTNGNLTSKTDASGSWTYSWDYENRLKQATLSGGVAVNYSYDALGRRVQRASSTSGTTTFVYDGSDVLRDVADNGSTIADYLNGPGIDNKLRETVNSNSYYFLADHLGTTRSLGDSTGTLITTVSYDAFGNITSGSQPTRYSYTGREADPETGLLFYRARRYGPEQGRFNSEDPIELRGGLNLYQYVGNNPTSRVDPLGLQERRVPGSETPAYNCMGWGLGYPAWVQQGSTHPGISIPRDVPASKIPGYFGCKWIKCNQKCPCNYYKTKVYEDSGDPDNWHVERKECGSPAWTSKNGASALYYDIDNPDSFYRRHYRPTGNVIGTCWCCPKRGV
jgi:RHS repeat-associated protein